MLRLLIVDDEQIIRESLSDMIDYKSIGYDLIGTAKNGMEAYDIIFDEYPDVVITDIRMPILNGLDLIEKTKKIDSNITFIVLSGFGEFEYAKRAMKNGIKHYLLKPTIKQELIDTLVNVSKEIMEEELHKKQEEEKILGSLQTPLQQSFIMKALESPQNLHATFRKYKNFLVSKNSCTTACYCFFVEETYHFQFIKDVNRILKSLNISLDFPAIYVRNTAIFLASLDTLSLQETFKLELSKLFYDKQTTSFEVGIEHTQTTEKLFENVIKRISRFERILLISENETFEISNSFVSHQKLQGIVKELTKSNNTSKSNELLNSLFPSSQNIRTAKTLAVNLFLEISLSSENSTSLSFDFLKKLYSCNNIFEIKDLFQALLSLHAKEDTSKTSNIMRLKNYVEENLASETLSLKWLAENYLFVNVDYLSKQFIKEEGIRFSEYITNKRMDEAINLMKLYKNDNIKDIAKQVGYGNNPQYFSQVFKKYTGYTPSQYIKTLS